MLLSQVASPPRVGLHTAMTGVMCAALCGAFTGAVLDRNSSFISEYFLVVQDAPVLFLLFVFLGLLRYALPASRLPTALSRPELLRDTRLVWIALVIVPLVVIVGSHFVTLNFPLSLDEFWANFDATVFAHGQLLAPVASEWRDYVPALQPMFRLDVPGNAFWISGYLPMNAAIRALFVFIGAPMAAGACLAAIAAAALFGIARRLWPERPDAALVSIILLTTSAQFLITAMTPYAMTAHLAFNLVWLWLFLRNTRISHGLAAGAAFVACGLHQVVFHPLFAAPFIVSLWFERRRKLAAYYTVVYAAIGLFWISYWSLVLGAASPQIGQSADVGLSFLVHRFVHLIDLSPAAIGFMILNLYRFLAWQNPLTIPLAIFGLLCFRNWKDPLVHLAIGIALTLLAVTMLMPFQGHGWGYRYLHGLLGSFALLAARGWIRATDRAAGAAEPMGAALVLATSLSVIVLLPWFGYQVRAFIQPYASAGAAIAHSRADVVFVDPTDIWYGPDLIRNDPFLRTPPKVFGLGELQDAQIRELCRRHDVALFDRQDARRFGVRPAQDVPAIAERNRKNLDVMRSLNCSRPL